jgi:hypothetical protein
MSISAVPIQEAAAQLLQVHCWHNIASLHDVSRAGEASAMRSLCCQTSNAIAHHDLSPLFQNAQVYVSCTYVILFNHGMCVPLPGCTLLPVLNVEFISKIWTTFDSTGWTAQHTSIFLSTGDQQTCKPSETLHNLSGPCHLQQQQQAAPSSVN